MNKGEVGRWREAKELYGAMMRNDPAFLAKMPVVDEKVALLALLALVFKRPTTERCLRFGEIADCCQIAMENVGKELEWEGRLSRS